MNTVIFRTKGNHRQGMGDVTGSIALAREFSSRTYKTTFLLDNDKEAIKPVKEAGYNVLPKRSNSENSLWKNLPKADIAIVNQLNTGYDTLNVIRRYSRKLVTIDDTGEASRALADVRINPLYFDRGAFCGYKYVPLNVVFQKRHAKQRRIKRRAENLLISMGGSDTYGFTPSLIKIIAQTAENMNITCITGRAFKSHDELKSALSQISQEVKLLSGLSPIEMCNQMLWADAMVCSGGITMFEAACLGLPHLVICAEPFEEETVLRMQKFGTCLAIPFSRILRRKIIITKLKKLLLFKTRDKFSKTGKKLINGKGASLMYRLITAGQPK